VLEKEIGKIHSLRILGCPIDRSSNIYIMHGWLDEDVTILEDILAPHVFLIQCTH
jgi:hypothetical protein